MVERDGTRHVDATAAGGERAQAEVDVLAAECVPLVEAAERDERLVADQRERGC